MSHNKSQIESQKTESKRKKNVVPVLASIAAVLVIAAVFFLQRPKQRVSPEPETSMVTDEPSHLSEAQLREIPDWYYNDSVTIKGNQICFARQDGLMSDDIYIKFVYVYTYDDQGQLYDMRCFDFYPTVEAAEKWYNKSINYNYDGGKNCHGYTQEDDPASYFCMDSTLVAVYGEDYFSGSQEATFDGAVDYWAGLGWTINRVNSDGASGLSASDLVPTPWIEGDWKWEFEGGTLYILGSGNMQDFEWDGPPWHDITDSIAWITIEDGITSIGDWAFAYCHNLKGVSIPNSVLTIGDNAFFDDTNYSTSVEIPEGVVEIGEDAFSHCWSLESVSIPSSVERIGGGAFAGTKLDQISISENNQHFIVVDDVLFSRDMTTLVCYLPTKVTTQYAIPDSVVKIETEAFFECKKLKSLIFPTSVTDVGSSAFIYCDNISDVFFSGTESQWNAISFDSGNESLTSSVIHYQSKG